MCVVWGIPYLLIKVAVGSVPVPMVVFARTALGALALLPLALRSGQLAALRHAWRPLAAFAALEMIVPWGLLSNAERQLPSSLAGPLTASVPIIGVLIARLTGGTERLGLRRWAGLLAGLGGIAVLAAPHLAGGHAWPIADVLLVAIGSATARLIAARKLADAPAVPMTVACPSLAALGFICTAWRSSCSSGSSGWPARHGRWCSHTSTGGGRRGRGPPAERAIHGHHRRRVRAHPDWLRAGCRRPQ